VTKYFSERRHCSEVEYTKDKWMREDSNGVLGETMSASSLRSVCCREEKDNKANGPLFEPFDFYCRSEHLLFYSDRNVRKTLNTLELTGRGFTYKLR
jgi:hypothetical protein